MRVAVLTPTIPPRARVLADAKASVEAQEEVEVTHLVREDTHKRGPAAVLNDLRREIIDAGIPYDYVMVLDDDDVLYPRHLIRCISELEKTGADIASPYCDTTGKPFKQYNQPRTREDIFKISCLAHTSVFKASWLKAGQWEGKAFDWNWWMFMVREGARFVIIPEVTWCYRLMGGNLSHGQNPWDTEL